MLPTRNFALWWLFFLNYRKRFRIVKLLEHLSSFIASLFLCNFFLWLAIICSLLFFNQLIKYLESNDVSSFELAKTKKINVLNFHYWKHRFMLALTLEWTTYVLKDLCPILPENPTIEQLDDLKKLTTAFKDDDLIVKTIIIVYMKDDLAKIFEDYPTVREVFAAVSAIMILRLPPIFRF